MQGKHFKDWEHPYIKQIGHIIVLSLLPPETLPYYHGRSKIALTHITFDRHILGKEHFQVKPKTTKRSDKVPAIDKTLGINRSSFGVLDHESEEFCS